jgi:multiple sugar transport system substrate-binding protein
MKKFVVALLLIGLALTGLSAGGKSETQTSQPPEKPFAGKTITLLMHPTLYGTTGGKEGIVAEFEKETGATVKVVTAPIPEHSEKAMLDFISGKGAYDVINMQNSDMTKEFSQFLLPLDSYIANAGADWDYKDIFPALSEFAKVDGKQLGIGYRWVPVIMYYRKDLLEKAGVSVPKTYTELAVTAKKLTQDTDNDGKLDVYGYVQRGKAPDEIAHDWLTVFYGYGGVFLKPDGTSGLNSPAGVAAAKLWKQLLDEKTFPPDVFAWGRDDYVGAMQQGRVAMGGYVGSYYGQFFGKDSKLNKEQIGWAPMPAEPGVKQGVNRAGGWFLVINKASKNRDAAWALVKTLTSKENQLREAVQWANGPIRASVFQAESFRKIWPQADALQAAMANVVADPAIAAQPKILEIIGQEVTAVMQGVKTAEKAMADAENRANQALKGF